MSIRQSVTTAAKWPFKQVAGWFSNTRSVLSKYGPDDFVPPTVVSTWKWLKQQVPRAFGFGTPGQQMSASVVLALASIFTSLFTGGVTLVFVTLFMLTFIGGALRLWPVVNDLWPFGEEQT